EQDLLLAGCFLVHVRERLVEGLRGVFKVDDVDLVAGAVDVLRHARIPETGLVSEVCACLKQVAHAYLGHDVLSRVRPPHSPDSNPLRGTREYRAGMRACWDFP